MRIAPGKVIVAAVFAIIALICFVKMAHVNDVQNLQIVQNVNGGVEVRRDGGWYFRMCPRIWTYPKASVEICNENDRDSIVMQFSNKTTAKLNCQIGYRIDGTNDNLIVRLHQQVEGNEDKIWKKVQTQLQTEAQCVASQYTPSESVEKFPEFAAKIHKAIVHNEKLLEEGIDVVSFTCAGLPDYDNETKAQFAKQKEADLAKRLAEAEKIRLESEKVKVEAEYARQIAEQKGQAEAQMAKDVQSAEREKKLAEIAAQKQVEVARLEKERAEIEVEKQKQVAKIEAEKLLAVAEVQKKTEAEKLEAVKLQADQRVAEANAKKVAIELSGAITEVQLAEIELKRQVAQYQWDGIAKGMAGIKLPAMVSLGGTGTAGSSASALDQFIQLLTMQKLDSTAAK